MTWFWDDGRIERGPFPYFFAMEHGANEHEEADARLLRTAGYYPRLLVLLFQDAEYRGVMGDHIFDMQRGPQYCGVLS